MLMKPYQEQTVRKTGQWRIAGLNRYRLNANQVRCRYANSPCALAVGIGMLEG